MIQLHNISLAFGGQKVLDNLTWTLRLNKRIGLIGPNGAGKSTLLRLIAGDLAPQVGEVQIGGVPVGSMAPSDLSKLRSVFQQSSRPDAPFTVQAVVAMGRYPYRGDPEISGDDDARAIEDAMARTNVTQFAGRSFATLSGGERTRVLMAKVI